jgi:hypothetical protein
METWDIWYPDAAATGLPFARASIDPADVVLLHASPEAIRVEVRDEAGNRVAFADQLKRDGRYYPMTRLRKMAGGGINREDGWPQDDDIGRVVILPGGEAGTLTSWWNAADGSSWRWTTEFFNKSSNN